MPFMEILGQTFGKKSIYQRAGQPLTDEQIKPRAQMNPEQQEILEEFAFNSYRPCCSNPTGFPDL